MKKVIIKICATVIICSLMVSLFASCGKTNTASNQSETSSALLEGGSSNEQTSTENKITGGGSKPRISSAFSTFDGESPVITFKNFAEKGNYTAKIVIKDLSGKVVFEEKGIKTNSYTLKAKLTKNTEYVLFAYYENESGTVSGIFAGIPATGLTFCYQKSEAVKGKYYFDGSITLDTINSYLDRATTFCQVFQPEDDFEMVKQSILGIGAKYVQRAAAIWTPGRWEYAIKGTIKNRIAAIHEVDPEVVFEACIFECVTGGVENIAIPAETFKAFGLTPETRNFDLEKMIFLDGYGKNKWGSGSHVPDITRIETQMFFYHRATFFMDLGFEALHLGQTNLIGYADKNNECWTKVIGMIRDYAKENARRHYVIIDGHNPSQNFVGSDGVMLSDFNAFPLRLHVAEGQKDHAPGENNPQLCVIKPGVGDAVYQKGIVGQHPCGWTTDNYPYLVEFDNWGIDKKNLNKASAGIWGYDEITWYASQPRWYRQEFTENLMKQIDSFNDNGHLALPTKRWISVVPDGNGSNCYYAAEKQGDVNFYGDLDFYKELWKKLGK